MGERDIGITFVKSYQGVAAKKNLGAVQQRAKIAAAPMELPSGSKEPLFGPFAAVLALKRIIAGGHKINLCSRLFFVCSIIKGYHRLPIWTMETYLRMKTPYPMWENHQAAAWKG